jgi:nitroimidazol reductase NimA-like FMN-containing flavoprotein (pyridoxamine 5'-phosphate oxidase superfamily)
VTAELITPTARTTVRRQRDRGRYERALVHSILDEALICHVGFTMDDGQPVVLPTIHARVGEVLYLHGAPASHMLRSLAGGVPACVTATLVDGIVFARSAFHHSMNYRSVVVLGAATAVEDEDEKRMALDALVEHVAVGRVADARPVDDAELRKTLVLRVPIDEASAKVREGGPLDDEEDLSYPVWAGVVPLRIVGGEPEPDAGIEGDAPGYARRWSAT